MSIRFLEYGNAPVPQTTEWGREAQYSIEPCQYAGDRLAFCQPSRQGEAGDKPAFGRQHFNRQRRAAVLGLCDLCGRPLKGRTKISLSDTVATHDANPMQYEPLVHRECAAISLEACPHLRRVAEAGKLTARIVTRYRTIIDLVAPELVAEQVPDYRGPRDGIAGYALIELLQWTLLENVATCPIHQSL